MQDGFTQVGAGTDDRRLAGKDLQHNVQTRAADELHVPVRMVRQSAEGGGPMKEHMDRKGELYHHLEKEKMRHHHAQEHAHNHMERHHKRHHDTQHGHDGHKHQYDSHHEM